eukprot:CAMPEP_0118945350 /NCGR_PEP_ID=MMETSP1169-20130426/42083_1 /TAXON_ID=36882 /ORGANISM="Pyramimonas obovata, Strain CCMP722" /LENGTH=63 /DNA_ID=CAMNT_0006891039 /DNA_START=1 /DNA_END=193 /DNA_ORIENTATION=-
MEEEVGGHGQEEVAPADEMPLGATAADDDSQASSADAGDNRAQEPANHDEAALIRLQEAEDHH